MDSLLNRLINAFGVSGHEEAVRSIIKEEVMKFGFSCKEDKMGNLIVKLSTKEDFNPEEDKKEKLMMVAHMDSIGVIVNYIDDNGFARVGSLGEFSAPNMINNFVRFKDGTLGRISSAKKDGDISDLFIDLGVSSREEALKLIKEGNVAAFNGATLEQGDKIIASALDNRVGCYILIKLLEQIYNAKIQLDGLEKEYYIVFTTQNQLGARGARAASHYIDPDYCIVVDVEEAGDHVGGASNLALGKGAAIKVMDRTLVVHHEVKEMLSQAAESLGLQTQYLIGVEGTDGATIHKERTGVKTGVLSVPCRYLHTNEEMVSMKDLEEAITILKYIVK